MKIKFINLEEYGVLPEKCICPICGAEVTVEQMAYEFTINLFKNK